MGLTRRRGGLLCVALVLGGCSTAEPGPQPVPGRAALPSGPAPRIAYADGLAVVRPDGTRVLLATPRGVDGVNSVRPYGEGWLIGDTRFFEGTNGLFVARDDTVEELGPCASGGGAVSADGRRAAWATTTCPETGEPRTPTLVHLRTPTGELTQALPRATNPLASVAGFAGDHVVVNRLFSAGVWLTDLRSPPRRVRRLGSVGGVTSDRLSGQLADHDAVGVVVDVPSGELRWRAPGVRLTGFSPDGALVLGRGREGWRAYDAASGAVRADLDLPPGVRGGESLVWEDDQHVLTIVRLGRRQAVLRLGLDGSTELATAPRQGRGLVLTE